MATRSQLVGELGTALQRYQRSVQAYDDAVGRAERQGTADGVVVGLDAALVALQGSAELAHQLTPRHHPSTLRLSKYTNLVQKDQP